LSDTQLVTAQLFQQARTLRINGDYDQSIALLKRAIEEQPNFAEAHMELGLAYCFSGLFDESIEELKGAAELNSSNPEIFLHLAKTYTMLGMYEEGAAAFKMVLSLSAVGDKFYDEASKQLSYFEQMF
jgi:tetratricopeptide (TPR) repeat protein